ncbi:hypothetical protein GFC29_1728 [Anoxybacillus sp. B7M1]|jgi:Protein of unknown function (DUF1189)|uniref:DUF1189 domain-containing protein n=1 Tax=Anoxybacteroides rupiense TaxID=311460 RepID=A0ABD5ISA7_9BACL|nr:MULTISPECIES: DUF1189 domain-containing protein [Anoxybacillus]ANB58201.1 hypothetical protein GFC28_3705 [Anoxybacillus sp. B2M1]ANB62470.1 hypothetical protein GFC29_1728 [Anoxybacillus sp. B7M1]KXG11292.1 hypothetical protein AT864_00375 [Anoxybacillus sp. P3H1B]MBB3906870.1 hypothetical protein [Anoxybacillus rupiensis]MED5050852.1 DUF1189 domain-containing protein [Anoxybacillus rupiensis]
MNLFMQLWKSLYSPKDIARFRFQKIGRSILYIFLLSLITSLPTTYYFTTSFIEGTRYTGGLLQNDIPSFTIENGSLHSSASEPIVMNEQGLTIVFDSTGKMTKEEVERLGTAIGLLKHEAVLVTNSQLQSYNYSMFPQDTKLTDQDVHSFIQTVQSLLPVLIPLAFLFLYIFTSASKFIGVCVLAFIGLILKGTLDKKISYRHTWVMSAYSITLSTIFFAIMEMMHTAVPYAPFLHWFVSITVLFLAIREIPSPKAHD